jgi:hypothetical protein
VKRIIVGEEFFLPRVSKSAWEELRQVLTFLGSSGNVGKWRIEEGTEKDALSVLSEHFYDFEIVKRCSICKSMVNVQSIEKHEMEELEELKRGVGGAEFREFAVSDDTYGRYGRRVCSNCGGNLKGVTLLLETVLGRCKVCRSERMMEADISIEDIKVMRLLNYYNKVILRS